MSIARPFQFVANTYAKASEVNADFDVLYSQVNKNISEITTNSVDIDDLENTKAEINGSTSERFGVADAVSDGDAINKQTLFRYIKNSLYYIDGFTINQDSGSPNDTILVTRGSCYDSTLSVVLATSGSITKQNTNQGASATYYVYAIGSATGSLVDILISTNSTTPSLPSGYTLFRRIGYYTTDSSKHINFVFYYGHSATENNSSVKYRAYRNINYASGVITVSSAPTSSTPFKAPTDGVYIGLAHKNQGEAYLYINGTKSAYKLRDMSDGASYNGIFVPLQQNDSVYWDTTLTSHEAKFYKYKA